MTLNPIGILQNKAKDPSLTSGAVTTLTAAAKHLKETYVLKRPNRNSSSVSGDATESGQPFYRPAARTSPRRNIPGRRGLSSSAVH